MLRIGLSLVVLALVALPATADSQPHFIVLPGYLPVMGGTHLVANGIVSGLRKTNPDATYEVYDWTKGHTRRLINARSRLKGNEGAGSQLAEKIIALRSKQPDQPLILVGYCGGAGIAILALEQLPPEVQVHQVILLASDISPNHNLTTVLDRSINGIDVFNSHFDFLIQGVGATFAGTIDRIHTPGAGMVGFLTPRNLDENARFLYSTKLREHPYSLAMATTGHIGGHFTYTPDFVNKFVSPIVR